MTWLLNYQQLKQPDLLKEFWLASGKALCLATTFEVKCKSILRYLMVGDYFDNGGVLTHVTIDEKKFSSSFEFSLSNELAKALEKNLGSIIRGKRLEKEFTAANLDLLIRAKNARNFIAHESANLGGQLSIISACQIREQFERLRSEVEALTIGDNLVSRWLYELDENEPAPRRIQEDYPQIIRHWIFGAIDSGLIVEAREDNKTLEQKLDDLSK